MSSPDLIDPSGIPQFTGDLEQLGLDAVTLGAEASIFRLSGANVHSTFQGLSAFYAAPEADQLFATTAPVATKSDAFADDLEKVGAALSAYEEEIRPLVAKLKGLKEQATTFRADIAGDDHWREDDDNVSLNNDLVHDVNNTTAAFWQAEITCHNKITALVGGTTLIIEDGASKRWLNRDQSLYGFTADVLEQSQDLPWGKTVEKERHGLDWLGHEMVEFGKGFVIDGVWGTIKGLGTLVGFDGLDAMGKAWDGLGKLATGVLISATPLGYAYWMLPDDKLPTYLKESRDTVIETGKALVAYDQWGTNPARASGAVTFNVLTTVFTGGAGAAAKGGAAARTVAVLGKAGKLVDPITYIGKAAKFGTVKVADLFTSLKGIRAGAYTDVLSGAGKVQADGGILKTADNVPVVVGNHIEWPDGTRLNLDDGSVIKADGTKAAAHVELSAADRAMLENNLAHREPAVVAAHGGGDDIGAVGRTGDAVPGGANSLPHESGGHVPGAAAHDSGHAPAARHESSADSARGATPSHGEGPTGDGMDSPTSGHSHGPTSAGHDGPTGSGDPAPPDAGHTGPAGMPRTPIDEIAPERYSRGTETAGSPSEPMRPEQEPGLTEELSRAKISPQDQARVIRTLSKEPFGADVADLISRGHLSGVKNYDEILKMCKQGASKSNKSMVPAAYMALNQATELQSRGFSHLAFELKDDATGLDLDVTTLRSDGTPHYGYQLKDVDNIEGIKSATKKAATQLKGGTADAKIAILDVHQSIADLNAKMFKEAEFQARRAGATFHLRFVDGSVTVPPNGPVFP
ncbi:hypothetical protein GCM10011579_097020 [Streptomyces albiflavescens]|uniref:Uncharacterized protein n=1 Tax=Streptomyces albiflavescens TaxID=1623582 RepID=A0A918DAD6_9ACTN|nr:hypothetical protein [Streptomyces albiflavescens]GGN96025.1 hypothetical protein GCM10011579_097020 [Streptomyces albiflavescens]